MSQIEFTLFSMPTVAMPTPPHTINRESLPDMVTFEHGKFYKVAYLKDVDCVTTDGQQYVAEYIFLEHPDLPDGVVGFRKSSF